MFMRFNTFHFVRGMRSGNFPILTFLDKMLSPHSENIKNISHFSPISRHYLPIDGLANIGRKDITLQNNDTELWQFNSISKIIHNDLTENNNEALKEASDWCSEVFSYNLKHGKKNRGTAVIKAYKILSNDATEDGLHSASILGWCVELMQAFFLIMDDVMDESTTRRGELCWYKKPDVGLVAINDGIMLQSGIYRILRKHFGSKSFYLDVVHEFLQVTEKTIYGQCLDMLSNPLSGPPDYSKYTIDKYQAIVEHKTAHYTYCLPVHLAMHLVGNRSAKEFKLTEQLCLKLGLLFQIQDDYLDCYGDPEVTGKLGTDIIRGKCSWFAVTFLKDADDVDKKEWMEAYGKDDKESVSKVMKLYEKWNMLEKYFSFENTLYTEIRSLIGGELTDSSMHDLFYYLLHKTYKRQK